MRLISTLAIFIALALLGCGDQTTQSTTDETGFTPVDLPTSLPGTYIDVTSGQRWYHPADNDYAFEIAAWFIDSKFACRSTRLIDQSSQPSSQNPPSAAARFFRRPVDAVSGRDLINFLVDIGVALG